MDCGQIREQRSEPGMQHSTVMPRHRIDFV